jgi:YaiO family outer membrane protein
MPLNAPAPKARAWLWMMRAGLALVMLGAGPAARAQAPTPRFLEVGLDAHALNAGFSDWQGLYVQGVLHETPRALWRAEAVFLHRFDDQGFLYKAEHTRHLSPAWFGGAALTTSSGGFFNPRLRADARLARKWLARRQWVTALHLTFVDAKDVHRDYAATVEMQYYGRTWVAQGGVRWNLSTPGAAWSRSYTAALTHGHAGRSYLTLSFGFGREAYQRIAPLTLYTAFASRDLTLTWRRWLGPAFGFNVRGSFYTNPYYHRAGVQVGFFKHF